MRQHAFLVAAALGVALAGGASPALAGFGPAYVVSPAPTNARYPTVALNARGDAVVAWSRRIDAYNSTVEATSRRAGAPFPPAVELSEPPANPPGSLVTYGQNLNPSAAIDADGREFVVWHRPSSIIGVVIEPGSTTGPRQTISTAFVSNGLPRVVVDAAGNATAFWIEADHLGVATRPRGGAFGAPQAVGAAGTWPARYDVAAGAAGDAAVVWSGGGDLWVGLRRGLGAFEVSPLRTGADHVDLAIGHVAMNGRGDAVVAWSEREASGRAWIRAVYRPAGGAFGPVETLGEVFYTGTYDVSVAVDSHGNALVAWLGRSLDPWLDAMLTARQRSASGGWSAPQALSATEPSNDPPVLAFDAADTAFALWSRIDVPETGEARAFAAVRPAGATSWTASPLSAGGRSVWSPVLAAGPPGHALAAYLHGFTDHFDVEVAEAGGDPAQAGGALAAPLACAARATSKVAAARIAARASTALWRGGMRALLRRGIAVRLPVCTSKVTLRVLLRAGRHGNREHVIARWSGRGRGQLVRLHVRGRAGRRLARAAKGRQRRLIVRVAVGGMTARRVVVLRLRQT